ncbi:MAG: hypothetical protein QNJ60_05450 [Xenococcaceae cyanobacterium MO_188.B19]|nr:hypothetical protein [Xenococcaceae cyanobacterium MO_188.B19]
MKNARDFAFKVDKGIVAEGMYSTSQYTQKKVVTPTEICEKLEQAMLNILLNDWYGRDQSYRLDRYYNYFTNANNRKSLTNQTKLT